MENSITATFDADILSDVLPNIKLSADRVTLDLQGAKKITTSIHEPTEYVNPDEIEEGEVWHRVRFDKDSIESVCYVYHNKCWHKSTPKYTTTTDPQFTQFFYFLIGFIKAHHIYDYSLYLTESAVNEVRHIGEGFFTSDLKQLDVNKNNVTFTRYYYNKYAGKLYTDTIIKLHTEWLPITEPVEMSKDHKSYKKCCEHFGIRDHQTKGIDLHIQSIDDDISPKQSESKKVNFTNSGDVFMYSAFDLYRSTIVACNLRTLLNNEYVDLGVDILTAKNSAITKMAAIARIVNNLFTSDTDRAIKQTFNSNASMIIRLIDKLESVLFTVPIQTTGNDKIALKAIAIVNVVDMLTLFIIGRHKADIIRLRQMVSDIHKIVKIYWNKGDDYSAFKEYESALLSIVVPVLHSLISKNKNSESLEITAFDFINALSDEIPWWTNNIDDIVTEYGSVWSRLSYKLFKTF